MLNDLSPILRANALALVFLLMVPPELIEAQNRVPNSSYESGGCPQEANGFTPLNPTGWTLWPGSSTADYFKNGCFTGTYPGSGNPHSGTASVGGISEARFCDFSNPTPYTEGYTASLTTTLTSGLNYDVSVELKYDPNSDFTSLNSSTDGFGIWLWNSASPPVTDSYFRSPSKFFPGCIGYWVVTAPTVLIPMNQVTTAYQTFSFQVTASANYNRIGLAGYHTAGDGKRYYNWDDVKVELACVQSSAPSSAISSINCPGASATLSVNGGSLGTGAVWKWYTGSCGGVDAGTGSTITVNPSSTTTYYVRAEGTCGNMLCRSVTVTRATGSGIWVWDGSSSTNWFEPCNWNRNTVPNCDSDVEIPNTTRKPSIAGGQAVCKSLEISSNAGARLDIQTVSGSLKVRSFAGGSCP